MIFPYHFYANPKTIHRKYKNKAMAFSKSLPYYITMGRYGNASTVFYH